MTSPPTSRSNVSRDGSAETDPQIHIDLDNLDLFDVKPSSNTHAITIHIYENTTYDEIKRQLELRYHLIPNVNGNGIQVTTSTDEKKVVISLYNNRTLFIQGAGCWKWRDVVFTEIVKQLLIRARSSSNEDVNKNSPSSTSSSTPIKSTDKANRSPFSLLNRMINSLRSPLNRNPLGTGKRSEIPSPIPDETDRIEMNTSSSILIVEDETPDRSKSETKSPDNSTDVCDLGEGTSTTEVTIIKSAPSSVIENTHQNDKSRDHSQFLNDNTWQENEITEDVNYEGLLDSFSANCDIGIQVDIGAKSSVKTTCNDRGEIKRLNTQVINQETEKCHLKKQLSDILSESKILKKENEELIKLMDKVTEENKKLKTKITKTESELKSEKSKLSKAMTDSLLFEEDNKKLKTEYAKLQKDKADLVSIMMKTNSEKERAKEELETGVGDLRKDIMTELQEIKEQIRHSQACRTMHSPEVNEKENAYTETSAKSTGREKSNKTTNVNINSKQTPKNALVLGDSITRVLSTNRMCDQNLRVAIKSHPGGRVKTAENTILNLSESDQQQIKSTDAFVLHVGTNNVSDADSCESIAEDFRDTVDTIKNVNEDAKIIISSIIPRRNDRLVNRAIDDTNKSLEKLCIEEECSFLDHSVQFTRDGHINQSLYRDNIHLNARGGRQLGTAIRDKLNEVLNLTKSTEGHNNSQNFHRGRSTGRSFVSTETMPIPSHISYTRRGSSSWTRTRQYQDSPTHQKY